MSVNARLSTRCAPKPSARISATVMVAWPSPSPSSADSATPESAKASNVTSRGSTPSIASARPSASPNRAATTPDAAGEGFSSTRRSTRPVTTSAPSAPSSSAKPCNVRESNRGAPFSRRAPSRRIVAAVATPSEAANRTSLNTTAEPCSVMLSKLTRPAPDSCRLITRSTSASGGPALSGWPHAQSAIIEAANAPLRLMISLTPSGDHTASRLCRWDAAESRRPRASANGARRAGA